MALAVYRNLFRATRVAFQGDERLLLAARDKIRQAFRDPNIPSTKLEEANDIATLLRTHVIQGKLEGDDTYKLRLHDQIERGNNESIMKADKKSAGEKSTGKRSVKSCSGTSFPSVNSTAS